MSEKMLRVPLGDLKTVRVKCKGTLKNGDRKNNPCGIVYEIEISQLGDAFPQNQCPRCNQTYFGSASAALTPLQALSQAIRVLAAMEDQLEIEFDLPLKG